MSKSANNFALRDALVSLAGDQDAHVHIVRGVISEAVKQCVLHGNINQLQEAAKSMEALGDRKKAHRCTWHAWVACIGAVPFIVLGKGAVTDTRETKRGTAADAAAYSDAAADAFAITFATRWAYKDPHQKPRTRKASQSDTAPPPVISGAADELTLSETAKQDRAFTLLAQADAKTLAELARENPDAARRIAAAFNAALNIQAASDKAAQGAPVRKAGKVHTLSDLGALVATGTN